MQDISTVSRDINVICVRAVHMHVDKHVHSKKIEQLRKPRIYIRNLPRNDSQIYCIYISASFLVRNVF